MDVELLEIRDFLAGHAPFDTLPAEVLDRLPRDCTMRYARRGTVVLEVGDRPDGLQLVRSGSVDVLDESGGLIERLGPGGAFGMSWLLDGHPTRHRCVATEDTLLLVLDRGRFDRLVAEHPSFVAFYSAAHHDRLSTAIAHLQQASSGVQVLSTRIRDLAARAPVTTSPDSSVAATAATMSEEGVSCILVTDATGVVGIVTDRDLRNRVLAAGVDPARPVREVMTTSPVTLRADAPAFQGLLEMVSRRIHHLPLVDDAGVPVGVVTTTDLVRVESSNPVYLAADIGRQESVEDVVTLAERIPLVLGQLLDRDVSAAEIGQVVTALGDAVRRRVVTLVEEEMGPPPTAYAWVVLGSAAREEEGLGGDQDHALVLGEPGHDAWFAAFAERVTDALADAGWPRCPGDVMATNPRWRMTAAQWRERFEAWSWEPRPEAVLDAAIAFDLRHLHGDVGLTEEVRRASVGHVSDRLLVHLSAQSLKTRPPLGFFRGFVLEHGGEHDETLNIKRGIAAVVQLARVYALRAGSGALATKARLDAAEAAGVVEPATATDLRGAWELMSYWRLRHQVDQQRAGLRPDNNLSPADLTDHQRRHLKDAFAVVRTAQQRMANRLPPGYL